MLMLHHTSNCVNRSQTKQQSRYVCVVRYHPSTLVIDSAPSPEEKKNSAESSGVRCVPTNPAPRLPSPHKTADYNAKLAKYCFALLLHNCSIISKISPAYGGLVPQTSYWGFALGPQWGLPFPDSLTNPPSQILDPPLWSTGGRRAFSHVHNFFSYTVYLCSYMPNECIRLS